MPDECGLGYPLQREKWLKPLLWISEEPMWTEGALSTSPLIAELLQVLPPIEYITLANMTEPMEPRRWEKRRSHLLITAILMLPTGGHRLHGQQCLSSCSLTLPGQRQQPFKQIVV